MNTLRLKLALYKPELSERFECILEKAEKQDSYKKGCLMLQTNIPDWLKFIARIDDNDVDETEGKEPEQHVTVLYGFDMNKVSPKDIQKLLSKWEGKVDLKIKGVSLFENEKFDVLKLDVNSEDLNNLNKNFKQLPYENDYPDYKPHITMAYLKKGMGEKYLNKFPELKSMNISSNKFKYSYSPKNGGKKAEFFNT